MFGFLAFVFFIAGFFAPILWLPMLLFIVLGAAANESMYGPGSNRKSRK